jgi:LytR cell envelope-related transcriptional attenuator/LytR_cpsA_psr family
MTPLDDEQLVDGRPDASPQEDEDLPPLKDWPPKEIVERRAALRDRAVRRRHNRRRVLLGAVAVVAVVALIALVTRDGGGSKPPVAAPPPPGPSSLVWTVEMGARPVTVVVAVPGNGHATALAVPNETEVDLPGGGPLTVGDAARFAVGDPGMLVAAVQAALDRRAEHYLVTDASQLVTLVDLLSGVDVETEVEFTFEGRSFGPGQDHLSGGAVLAYLETALDEDLTGRWEEVLAGLLSASDDEPAWSGLVGTSDALDAARGVLTRAVGGIVLELPTTPSPDGGIEPDGPEVVRLLTDNFGPDATPLVRVIVLNGNGDPGVSARVASLIAPGGFQVIAAQNAPAFDVVQTQVVAANEGFGEAADRVVALLGMGMVYVDPQPTGIADITVVVGKDFQSG